MIQPHLIFKGKTKVHKEEWTSHNSKDTYSLLTVCVLPASF